MKEIITKYNPWWNGRVIEPTRLGMERDYLGKILRLTGSRETIKLAGIRGSGKTTLLYQIIDYLLRNRVAPERIFYIRMDDVELALYDEKTLITQLITGYQEITGRDIGKGGVFLFLDEFRHIPNRDSWLKAHYDKYDFKLIVSGSSPLILREPIDKPAGREIGFTIMPFSFREYLKFRGIEIEKLQSWEMAINLSTDLLSKKEQLLSALSNYLSIGGFPEVISGELEERALLLGRYFREILYRDVIRGSSIRDASALEKLSIYLLKHLGQRFNFTGLAHLMKISPDTVIDYTNLLENSFMFNFVSYHSTAPRSTTRKERKPYCTDIGIRNALITEWDYGVLAENLVFDHLRREYTHINYFGNSQEGGFVVKTDNAVIPVVVNYRDESEQDEDLTDFMEKFHVNKGFVVTRETYKSERVGEKEIIYVPLWLFLLWF